MDPRIEAALDEWRFRACDPGYAGLHALADAEFTGGVVADETIGFMVNGRIVGLTGGTIEGFWGTDFSALEADGPELPLLCAMLVSESQEEGEYYTGETPLSEVDVPLRDGGFTGYLELSENVFSGDYFFVYYGGTSFSVAILGTEDRIVTGDEARGRAGDEVGIYTVNSTNVDVVDIPDPEVDDSIKPTDPEPADLPTPDDGESHTSESDDEVVASTASHPSSDGQSAASPSAQQSDQEQTDMVRLAEAALGQNPSEIGKHQDRVSGEIQSDEWLMIPALDPARTGDRPGISTGSNAEPESTATPGSETDPVQSSTDTTMNEDALAEKLADTETALEAAEKENERLQTRIDDLEAQLEEVSKDQSEETFTPEAALDGTNLFVRYETSTNFTLTDAIDGDADRSEVRDNLRLESHTTFETADLTVQGEPFGEFLEDSMEYRFSDWLLGDLVFELIEGGDRKAFAGLIETIPEIDRIEFRGEVPVHTRASGERESHTYRFDLVYRNSMGDPILIADVHDARTPVIGESVSTLLSESNSISSARQSMRGAFFVTRSYFEPEALEAVADATGGSLLRGGSRQCYVPVSRKHGFHLCLIEARNSTFHLNVPEN